MEKGEIISRLKASPFLLRISVIWTLAFAVLGIVIQSLSRGEFVFLRFFFSNYWAWFGNFFNFFQTTEYNTGMNIFTSIMSGWYYFLYTLGLIVFIVSLIKLLINSKKNYKKFELHTILPDDSSLISIPEQEKIQEHREKIDDWLEEGLRLLAEGNLEEAELIYQSVRKEYNPEHDLDNRTYKRILDFYIEIRDEKKAGKK